MAPFEVTLETMSESLIRTSALILVLLSSGCRDSDLVADRSREYQFSTYAGTTAGHRDGDRLEARFWAPEGIAIDDLGNLYITEYRTTVVRKIDTAGQVTTLGGSGLINDVGAMDGPANRARFNRPHGVDVGSGGTVFVSDMHNHSIRKIDPNGMVSTFAGELGSEGSQDGKGQEARFSKPEDVAIDSRGNIFVADTYNYTIRKIDSSGTVSTFAGKAGEAGYRDGSGDDARFDKPIGLAIDGSDNIYVVDANYDGPEIGNCVIRQIDPSGKVTTIAGRVGEVGPEDGPSRKARFHKPVGIDVTHEGIVYIADTEADTIRRIGLDGTVVTLGGTYLDEGKEEGSKQEVRFKDPQAIVVDKLGRLFIADTLNNRIVVGVPVE